IAYCIGYLTTMVPMPAGLGVLDSGLAGSLVLYGLSPSASVGAVVVYHSIAIWVPAVGGLVAWLVTRRRHAVAGDTVSPAQIGASPPQGLTPRTSKPALRWRAPAVSEDAR